MIRRHEAIKRAIGGSGMQRNDVLRAIDIMALHEDCDDAQLVRVLAQAGFSKLESELLVERPSRFARQAD